MPAGSAPCDSMKMQGVVQSMSAYTSAMVAEGELEKRGPSVDDTKSLMASLTLSSPKI